MNGKQRRLMAAALVVAFQSCEGYANAAHPRQQEKKLTQSKFYCNTKALNSTERARHKLLTDKLVSRRTQIVEAEKGYEFQYNPSAVSLSELADWVAVESKCCPFFDFHIDLENEGKLICLRLTGENGVKEFIRAEFLVSATT